MSRITKQMLKSRVDALNHLLERPATPYTKTEAGISANVGNFHLSQAYGGYCVHEMHNHSGGVTAPIWQGHIPARDAFDRLCAFIAGIQYSK